MSGVSFSKPPEESRDPYAGLFADNALIPIKPTAKPECVTIFRPIPERDQAGNVLPMVVGFDAYGPRFSAVRPEHLVVLAGGFNGSARWTGFTTSSDMPALNDFDNPWSGTFIRLKSKLKKREVPTELLQTVLDLVTKPADRGSILDKPTEYMLVQGVCIQLNSKPCTPPMIRSCLLLKSTAAKALQKIMAEAVEKKEDLFNLQTGISIVITGQKSTRGLDSMEFVVSRGQPIPLPDKIGETWVPWDKAIKYRTYDEHVAQMARCFPPVVLAMNAPVGQTMTRLGISTAPVAPAAPPVAAQPVPQVAQAIQGAPATQTVTQILPQFNWAASLAGVAAPAPAPAPVAPVSATPPAAVTATQPASADVLAATFAEMIKSIPPKTAN